ncbi:MAG TPA: efflux RND transporter periplasmic adaptor subunit [Acidobacteriaceae bacterium]|nr:efflux RND transporter periplasmic adaptor subunit [Acidobacteriaceae bacterium]
MTAKKLLVILGAVLVAGAVVGFTVVRSQSGYTKVVTGKVIRENLVSTVSGTGQIKPKTYVNIGATAFGRITHLYVKEGDHVKRGQTVATIESVQARASVDAQQASIDSAKTDIASYVAAENTAQATVEHSMADLEQKRLDWQRAQALYQAQLIARQDYDSKKAAYDTAVATLAQSKAQLAQARAQTASAQGKYGTAVAMLRSDYDSLNKTVSIAPFDGIVTNMPVREGETVVVGIQNAEGSTLMTLADMSIITAEVKVDETDIVNVALGQPVDVTVDALPGKVFRGHVTEIGDQALLRSTGIATSQSTTGTEEAKDFKVVVRVDNPSSELRPGLSATAKITTARRANALAIPIQALTLRGPGSPADGAHAANGNPSSTDPSTQGVFVLRSEKGKLTAEFVPVTTGITGTTDIEALSGLKQGDEIVIGSYKTLRTLKSGTIVKRDTAAATEQKDASS